MRPRSGPFSPWLTNFRKKHQHQCQPRQEAKRQTSHNGGAEDELLNMCVGRPQISTCGTDSNKEKVLRKEPGTVDSTKDPNHGVRFQSMEITHGQLVLNWNTIRRTAHNRDPERMFPPFYFCTHQPTLYLKSQSPRGYFFSTLPSTNTAREHKLNPRSVFQV